MKHPIIYILYHKLINITLTIIIFVYFIADLLKKYKEKYKQNEKIFGNTYIKDYKNFICLMDICYFKLNDNKKEQ